MAAYVLTIEPILSDRCYSVSVAGDSFSVPGISDARRTADLRSRDAKSPKVHHTKKKRSPMRWSLFFVSVFVLYFAFNLLISLRTLSAVSPSVVSQSCFKSSSSSSSAAIAAG